MWPWVVLGLTVLIGIVVGLALLWRPLRTFSRQVQVERARELFRLQREGLEARFLKAASTSGKPRGLRWRDCDWENGVEVVRDKHTGQIAALVGVTIKFEAVEGGDMEGLPAVGNLRNASAVFFFQRGQWHTVGRALFNMNPDEAVVHFKNQYERVG